MDVGHAPVVSLGMFTPARVCFALNTALAGAVVSMTAAHAPTWIIIMCGAATAFTGGLLAFSGPVQAGSGDTVTVRTPTPLPTPMVKP